MQAAASEAGEEAATAVDKIFLSVLLIVPQLNASEEEEEQRHSVSCFCISIFFPHSFVQRTCFETLEGCVPRKNVRVALSQH